MKTWKRATGPENGKWKGGRNIRGDGYIGVLAKDHPRASKHGYVAEHILHAEKALGKPLPPKAEVHHVNSVRYDNRNANLVICPDHRYHQLLHIRQDALDACGNANWRRCQFCQKYDDVKNLVIYKYKTLELRPRHLKCQAEYALSRKAAKKLALAK